MRAQRRKSFCNIPKRPVVKKSPFRNGPKNSPFRENSSFKRTHDKSALMVVKNSPFVGPFVGNGTADKHDGAHFEELNETNKKVVLNCL